ncbi:MAG: glycosyltransferase [Caldithrix sp.]|nr:glycosyltransferase [Caldithrix sp.]
MAKRCLIVCYYFPPIGGGGVQRILKWIKYGTHLGWRYTVVTADENSDIQPLDDSLLEEVPESTRVIRKPAHIGGKNTNSLLNRFMHSRGHYYWKRWVSAFLYLPDSRKHWIKTAEQTILKEIRKNKYDCVLCSAPPYSILILATRLQKKISQPVIADMRDYWTKYPFKIYPTAIHKWIDRKIEDKTLSRINFGISAYHGLLADIQKRFPNSNARWIYIPNGYDEDDFTNLEDNILNNGYFNMAIAGTLYSHLTTPRSLFKAIHALLKTYPELRSKIRLHYIGKTFIALSELARKYGIEDVVVRHGYMQHKKYLNLLNSMDTLIFILDHNKLMGSSPVGGRVFEYIRLRKPILALVPENGEAARIIRQTRSGIVISPRDVDSITQVLSEWMTCKPQFLFEDIKQYNRELQAETINAFIEQIIQSKNNVA